MSRFHLILLAVLTALAISYLLSFNRSDNAPTQQLTTDDDYYFEDFVLTAYDRDGEVSHTTHGKILRQLRDTHDFKLESPQIELNSGKTRWEIAAESGWMNAAMSRATLRGNVVAHTASNNKLLVTTSDLDLDIPARIATTDALVNISQGNNRLRGEALTANLRQQQLQLNRNIEGYYVP